MKIVFYVAIALALLFVVMTVYFLNTLVSITRTSHFMTAPQLAWSVCPGIRILLKAFTIITRQPALLLPWLAA